MPGGFLVSAIIGILGAWVGGNMIGDFGPDVAGVSLIPCVLGSVVFVFIFSIVSDGFKCKEV
jgi:uncharacterized membrane protein YeaQ/YmgE (transglycosylase-associated protein family)